MQRSYNVVQDVLPSYVDSLPGKILTSLVKSLAIHLTSPIFSRGVARFRERFSFAHAFSLFIPEKDFFCVERT